LFEVDTREIISQKHINVLGNAKANNRLKPPTNLRLMGAARLYLAKMAGVFTTAEDGIKGQRGAVGLCN